MQARETLTSDTEDEDEVPVPPQITPEEIVPEDDVLPEVVIASDKPS